MTATATTPRHRYFDGSPGRELVMCPDCGCDAPKALGGNHGGGCNSRLTPDGQIRTDLDAGHARIAEAIIRDVAAANEVFSSNATRKAMDSKGIPVAVRTAAFRRLIASEVMTPIGYEDSTEKPARGRPPRQVRTYRSLIVTGATARTEAGG